MTDDSIHRTVVTLEVFSRGPLVLDGGPDDEPMYDPIIRLVEDMTEGDKVGEWGVALDEVVEGAALLDHLERIGNDGKFFATYEEDAECFDSPNGKHDRNPRRAEDSVCIWCLEDL